MSHRTQITLSDAQYARLKEEADRTGLGLAELVRRALVAVYGDPGLADAAEVLEATFGAWEDRPFDGEAYVDSLRPGMAHRFTQ